MLEKRGKRGKRLKVTDQPLFRVGLVLAVLLLGFILVRSVFIPESFGAYGYYRGDNVAEWSSEVPQYSPDAQTCQSCHQNEYTDWTRGAHAAINCESCHGPAGQHAGNPAKIKPVVPNEREFCAVCHDILPSRPAAIRQIDAATHNTGNNCASCHNPHKPGLGG